MPAATGGARPSRRPDRAGGSGKPAVGTGTGTGTRTGTGTGTGTGVGPGPRPSMAGAGGKTRNSASRLLMDDKQQAALRSSLHFAGLYINNRHLEMLTPPAGTGSMYRVQVAKKAIRNTAGIAVYRINKLMYNAQEDSFEKLTSLYSAINSFGAIAAMIIKSDGRTNELYLCTQTSGMGDVAGDLLEGNLHGQFPGCDVVRLTDPKEKAALLDGMAAGSPGRTVRSISMIPSRREDEKQRGRDFSAQGIEKFADAMSGRKYTLVVISQPVSPDAMDECAEGLEDLFTCLSPYSKEQVSYAENETDSVNYSISTSLNSSVNRSISKSFGSSHTSSISSGKSTNRGRGYEFFGVNHSSGSGTSQGFSTADGTSTGTSQSTGTSEGSALTDGESSGTTFGKTKTLTLSRDNKAVINLLQKIDEHVKRINMSQTFGMWNCASYLITDDIATANIGTSTLASLFAGDSIAAPRAYYNQWDSTCQAMRDEVLEYVSSLQHPQIRLTLMEEVTGPGGVKTLQDTQVQIVTPAVMVSGKELPTIMGLPRKSVPGVTVDTMAEFGRNIPNTWKAGVKRPVEFGTIYHMGQEESTGTRTVLDLDTFASHMFICGSSGAGKSNTTYNLLDELIRQKIPFLVIEPAKGEYKTEFGGLPGIHIFTADMTPYRQLRINPFEFSPAIHIIEHLDNLVQVISACWPLYGAMPGILKQAFERAYINHGWDLTHSERVAEKGSRFPVFRDLIHALNSIIEESPYSPQTKGDYKGALVNRVSSLCNGFEGEIFGSSLGVPDRTLFGANTIVDLSSIGSDETRSLIMGIMIIKLREYRKAAAAGPNSALVHVTVLEEAHNILKRCSQETGVETGNVQGAAVGSLCRCIAELRSSGEGFMIIDQSPGAVDEAAIKNTAIKIVMRLAARDDCEAMGTALSLNDDQVRELSRLQVGVAAIFHVGWTDTVLARMGKIWSKKYRLAKPPEFSKAVCIRIRGAIVQLMYQNIAEGYPDGLMSDVEDLLRILCEGALALKPVLPSGKKEELADQVRVFVDNNAGLIGSGDTDRLMPAFIRFAYDFLGIESLIRVCPLHGVNGEMTLDPLTAGEAREAVKWEKEIRGYVSRYLYMPEQCEPVKAYTWPVDPCDAEYFWEIYQELLVCYGRKMEPGGDFRYDNAVYHLITSGWFRRAARK